MSHGVICINPKFRSNVGMILRLSAAFNSQFFYYTGDRAEPELSPKGKIRLPREERMEEYSKVHFGRHEQALHNYTVLGYTPVAVDFQPGFEALPTFEHPELAVYVFGAEDKGIPQSVLRACHRFVYIPSEHVLNLATAVAITLYDRSLK